MRGCAQAAGGTPTLPEAAQCGAELTWGERVYAEKWKMRRENVGDMRRSKGNKNPAMPWGLRDERRDNIIY